MLSTVFLPQLIELSHPRAFLVVPPGWWGAVAGVPGVEADQVGAGLGELVDDLVCFGGGEVGGGPARRDDVRHSTALACLQQHAQPMLVLVSVVELGDQVEAGRFGVVLYQLPLPGQLEGVAGRAVEDGDRPIARLVVQRGGWHGGAHGRVLLLCVRCCLCCHLHPPLVIHIAISLFCVSSLSIDAQMDGKVQSNLVCCQESRPPFPQ